MNNYRKIEKLDTVLRFDPMLYCVSCCFPFGADRHDSTAVSQWLPILGACKSGIYPGGWLYRQSALRQYGQHWRTR